VAPIHPTSIHGIIRFVGNVGVLSKAATQAKNSTSKMHFSLFGLLTGERH